ncbi:MAG: hypothetical protein KDD41_09725 [Flavobacteriales bacterium]|nr:hypothetical protein [Flavobacteriales bacterium]
MLRILIIPLLLLSAITLSQEKNEWHIEFNGGAPYNIDLPLTIEQTGQPTLNLTAHFDSEPFVTPVYWVFRVAKWKNNKAWEFEMVHQKLYLQNPTPEIQYFSITHGFNTTFINRSFKTSLPVLDTCVFRIGTGVTLAHAENMIRGKELDQNGSFFDLGYYPTLPTINIALTKEILLAEFFYLNLEIKHNISYAHVPVVDGKAKLWHASFALVAGGGIRF